MVVETHVRTAHVGKHDADGEVERGVVMVAGYTRGEVGKEDVLSMLSIASSVSQARKEFRFLL